MEILILQNQTGRFNLLGNEKTFEFSLAMVESAKERKPILVDGVKAILSYSGTEEDYEDYVFQSPFCWIGEVFEKCFDYAGKIISSTDYKLQCLAFAKLYTENFTEINAVMLEKRNNKIKQEIQELQNKLKESEVISDISYEVNKSIDKEIKSQSKRMQYYDDKLKDYKEESDKYSETLVIIAGLKLKIDSLENSKIVAIE